MDLGSEIPDPVVKKAPDPGSGSATLLFGVSSAIDGDPDPAYHFDADPDPIFNLMRIRIHNTKCKHFLPLRSVFSSKTSVLICGWSARRGMNANNIFTARVLSSALL